MLSKTPKRKSIFISSTFRDMQAERDVLRDKVLPKVNAVAATYGAAVELIDLRWGVDTTGTSEREQNQKVLRTCLDEIQRARPFFIGILGDRYGWVPPEREMAEAINEVAYQTADFHQSVTALEIEYGVLQADTPPVCLFYFRHIKDYSSLAENVQQIYCDRGAAQERLRELKNRIKNKFNENVKEYEAEIANGEVVGLSVFADMVAEDIIKALRREWGEPPAEPPSIEEQEEAAISVYRQSLTEGFVGCEAVVETLKDFCLSEDESEDRIWLLTGELGCGKSALLCRVMEEIEDKCLLLPYFCGLTPRASIQSGLLEFMIYRLKSFLEMAGIARKEVTNFSDFSDFSELKGLFFTLLGMACEKKRVVIIVDALDKLRVRYGDRCTGWLDGTLPPNCRVFCSTILFSERLDDFASVLQHGRIFDMPTMDEATAATVIRVLAKKRHKQIPDEVIDYILCKTDENEGMVARNPLYLSLLIQDLAMIDRYEHAIIDEYARLGMTPMAAITRYMKERVDAIPPNAEGAFVAIVERIERLIGKDFVSAVLSLLQVSRKGLRESDLAGAMRLMGLPYEVADFSWLRQMLGGMLVQRDELQWDFLHFSAKQANLKDETEGLVSANLKLAEYFVENAANDTFCQSEVLYHLYLAQQPEMAAKVIHDTLNADSLALYKEALAYIYTSQQTNETGWDFLLAVIGSTENIEEETRWRVAYPYINFLYIIGIDEMLPYGTPLSYCAELQEAVIKCAESSDSPEIERTRIIGAACNHLANIYQTAKAYKNKYAHYSKRAAEIWEWVIVNQSKQENFADNLAMLVEARAHYLLSLYEEESNSVIVADCRQWLDALCSSLEGIVEQESEYTPHLFNGYASIAFSLNGKSEEDSAARRYYIEKFISFIGNDDYGSFNANKAQINLWHSLGALYEREGELAKALHSFTMTIQLIKQLLDQTQNERYLPLLPDVYSAFLNAKRKAGLSDEDIGHDCANLTNICLKALRQNPTISAVLTQMLSCRDLAEYCAEGGQPGWAALLAGRYLAFAQKIHETLSKDEKLNNVFDDKEWLAHAEAFVQKYPLPADFIYEDYYSLEEFERNLETNFPKMLVNDASHIR
jgi:hypothetical protein